MGLAYRTVQYPQMEDCASSGKAKDLQIGERYHVTYLNAAGREVLVSSAHTFLLETAPRDLAMLMQCCVIPPSPYCFLQSLPARMPADAQACTVMEITGSLPSAIGRPDVKPQACSGGMPG